jgi:tyrosine decarboxylase/aspartate 1-decarboxylase
MQEKGVHGDKVIRMLRDSRKKDLTYARGRILSSMCTSPHPLTREVYPMFMETNLGDPGLFQGTKALEEEAVRILGRLLGREEAAGYILSGGTEANISALWIARNRMRRTSPEIILPDSAHFSLDKAADMLGFKAVRAPLLPDHSVDVERVKELVTGNTAALVGVAGSTEYGAVDDIEALSDIALDAGVHLHVDAAFGGFVLPFLKELGYDSRPFDFSVQGVSSMTVDPHKMGMAPIPAGALLLRSAEMFKVIETSSPYLTERKQYTVTGTRSGAAAASVYALLRHLGKEGYRRNVESCMKVTLLLYKRLTSLGLRVEKPWMNILVFDDDGGVIRGKLQERGWVLSRTRKGEARLVIMPHVTKEVAEEFIRDLRDVMEK